MLMIVRMSPMTLPYFSRSATCWSLRTAMLSASLLNSSGCMETSMMSAWRVTAQKFWKPSGSHQCTGEFWRIQAINSWGCPLAP